MQLGNKLDLQRIINHVRGTVILHNYLVGQPYDEEWIQSEGDDDDLEAEAVSNNSNQPDNRRRSELLFYLSELEETTIN